MPQNKTHCVFVSFLLIVSWKLLLENHSGYGQQQDAAPLWIESSEATDFCGFRWTSPEESKTADAHNEALPHHSPSNYLIPSKPPDKNFKVAVLYFKLADDTFELGNATAGWPHTRNAPLWKGQFLINTPYDSTTYKNELAKKPESITAYFYQMSGGYLWLYGDEITYTGPPLTEKAVESKEINWHAWSSNNTKILQWLVDHYDLTQLDNFGDGQVDLILLICRARLKFGFAGEATISLAENVVTRPGQPLIGGDNGTYQTDCYLLFETRHLVAHEIGHRLGFVGHVNGLHRWNLMSGSGEKAPRSSGVTMSAYEKNRLGWLEYEVIDKTTQNISLSNLTVSNRAIRIPIKGTEDYFVLENRQYSEPFEPHAKLPGAGLLIYYVYKDCALELCRMPNIIPADGNVTKVIEYTSGGRGVFFNGDDSDLFGNYGINEITPYTTPSTSTPSVANTGIAIKNIHYSGKDIVFDVYHDYVEDEPVASHLPISFGLRNYPNPFRWHTKIYFELPQSGHTKLVIYNLLGQPLATLVDEFLESWNYAVDFDGTYYPSGPYLYVLETTAGKESGKMTLIRDP